MKKASVLGIGVATMDIYVNHGRMYPGGNEYNVACNARILGAESGFLGVFGNDRAGEILEETLQKFSVCLSMCRHEEGSSGYSLVELLEGGDRKFLDWNKDGVTDRYPIQFTKEELEYIKQYQVACIGRCSTVTVEKIKKMKDYGINVCYDFHAIYSEEEIKSICPLIRYAFFSCSHLSEEEIRCTLKYAVEQGAGIAIGTRGALSVLAYDGENYYEQETYPVEHVLDALGAGDSFIGAFLVNYLQEEEMDHKERVQNALKQAAKHAATVIQTEGSVGVGFDADPERLEKIIG